MTEMPPKVAKDQLSLVLSFFSRVDAKASVVLAIDTAMAGYLASRLPSPVAVPCWELVAPALDLLLLALSFIYLYKGAFPVLEGGSDSLVYFREIAKRTEARFIDDFCAQSEAAFSKDLLGQVWRNSQILTMKFNYLRWAFIFMAVSVVPWVVSLAEAAMISAAKTP